MGQMIVTCDHCGTRYKLDEAKIPGRGARVTCPSCKHVFVVYRKPADAAEGASAGSAPSAAPPRPSIDEEIADLDPDNLDFRSVGIASWKVKVKIGLVYDFNDFKTIDKYIREGRVSGSDLLSHDGESWTPIEDIGDLRRHFCEVFVRARRALESGGDDDEDDFDEEEPTRIMPAGSGGAAPSSPRKLGAPKPAEPKTVATARAAAPSPALEPGGDLDLASAIADATADLDAQTGGQPTGPRFVDPFEAKRAAAKSSGTPRKARSQSAAKKSKPGAPPSEGGGGMGRLVAIGAVMIAVVLGGLYYSSTRDSGTTAPPPREDVRTRPGEQPEAPPNSGEADEIQRQLLEELEASGEPIEEEPADPNLDEWGNPIKPKLTVVVPEEFRDGGDGLNGGTMSTGDKTPAEYAADGAAAKRRGDWGAAVSSYQQAASMDPRNASYQEGLGEALARSGKTDQAIATLERASNMGATRAERLLGDIYYDKLGDDSSAVRHYEVYLSYNPPDAAQVKNRIAAIRGG